MGKGPKLRFHLRPQNDWVGPVYSCKPIYVYINYIYV